MILPDLQKEIAYWRERLNLGNWKIAIRYEADPRDPETGAQVFGYCIRQSDIPSAKIVVRTPKSEADLIETHDTIVHELLHCRLAALEGGRTAEENAVWTLAPLLTELRMHDPSRAKVLLKALARPKTSLVAQFRARAGGIMDPEKLKAIIAAIKEGNGEAALGLLEALLTDAVAGVAAPDAAPPVEAKDPPPPPAPPPAAAPTMGADPDEKDKRYKALEEKLAADRAAAVDSILDTRPDLSADAKAPLREIGVAHGPAKLRELMLKAIPPPKAAPAADTKPETRAKIGLEKAPRGGTGAPTTPAPSGDKKMNQLFRVMPDGEANEGIERPDPSTGRLIVLSVAGAHSHIKQCTAANVAAQKAKTLGGAA